MDAYDISEKIKKYWMALIPKNSGEITKSKNRIKVVVKTPNGFRNVARVSINGDAIELELEE